MADGIEQKSKFNIIKGNPIFMRCVGVGFGAMLALVIVFSFYSWHFSRSKAWDTKSISCDFDRVMTEGEENTYLFSYSLQNNTNDDYTLTSKSDFVVAAKLKRDQSISPDYTGKELIGIDTPIFIPAKQKTHFNIHLNYPSKVKSVNLDNDLEKNKYLKDVKNEISKQLPNIDGFVIYDKSTKYQIILPRGW